MHLVAGSKPTPWGQQGTCRATLTSRAKQKVEFRAATTAERGH